MNYLNYKTNKSTRCRKGYKKIKKLAQFAFKETNIFIEYNSTLKPIILANEHNHKMAYFWSSVCSFLNS
jgi:hypothetical protein